MAIEIIMEHDDSDDSYDDLTISRARLVEIATEALAASEGVTDEQKLEMCETAHSVKEILLGSWLKKGCGCLVGSTYVTKLEGWGGNVRVKEILGAPMLNLGLDFDNRLCTALGTPSGVVRPVRVID